MYLYLYKVILGVYGGVTLVGVLLTLLGIDTIGFFMAEGDKGFISMILYVVGILSLLTLSISGSIVLTHFVHKGTEELVSLPSFQLLCYSFLFLVTVLFLVTAEKLTIYTSTQVSALSYPNR